MTRAVAIGLVLCFLDCSSPAPTTSSASSSPSTEKHSTFRPALDAATEVSIEPDANSEVPAPAPSCIASRFEVGKGLMGYRATGQECNGIREGVWKFSFTDGQAHREGAYLGGAETGPWVFWFHNGKIRSEGSFERGQRVGIWIRNHENGTRSLEGSYSGGLRDGRWRRWHNNGQLYEDRGYKEGGREGLHRRWNAAGQLRYVRDCKNDRCRVQCKAKGTKGCPVL